MARVCVRHPFQHSESICGACGEEFCRDCLVYPHGPRKLPLCVPCALAAGGVRAGARARPALSRKEIKSLAKERRKEDRALAKLQRRPSAYPDIDNPFPPGWALQDGDGTEPDGDVFAMRSPANAGPPMLLPDTDLLAEARAAAAVRPAVAPDRDPPPPRPPALAELTEPPVEPDGAVAAPVGVGGDAGGDAGLGTDAGFRDDAAGFLGTDAGFGDADGLGDDGGLAEDGGFGDDEGADEDALRRNLPLPTLRRRHDVPDDNAEPAQMIAWLDEVFAPRADDTSP